MARVPLELLDQCICPNCWATFAPEEVLWIAAHADLLGDQRLGPEQSMRFLPTRFDRAGNAIDPRGATCHALACPKCHLPVPRAVLEMRPLFLSILGTPACGKSFFLTAMSWTLRSLLPQRLHLAFTDVDPTANQSLTEYEELLFLNQQPEQLIPLGDLIRKTELLGDLYQAVRDGNQITRYLKPFLFSLTPTEDGTTAKSSLEDGRLVVLYDNAGEHFLTGQDSPTTPVTQHLAQSQLLLFLFDPTQDPRFRTALGLGPATAVSARNARQDMVLREAAARIRRYRHLAQTDKVTTPLFLVLTKADLWARAAGLSQWHEEPWQERNGRFHFDAVTVEAVSQTLQRRLRALCPEVVAAAEEFSERIVYFPVSALGESPEPGPDGRPAIRPGRLKPTWVTVPFIYGIRLLAALEGNRSFAQDEKGN